ncbi:hypothetical protein SLS62_001503 [Diatrype stigma]|uniref:2EXR domain-containing protein n=1 Tax=Diatrype stigma TaxID=117547 RepID=A0AAN9YWR2_9PEZI
MDKDVEKPCPLPSSSSTPSSFPQFSRLPTELRLQIWRQAMPRRNIAVRFKQDLDAWNWADEAIWWMCYQIRLDSARPAPRLPPAAQASREAREEVLRWYGGSLEIEPAAMLGGLRGLDEATRAEFRRPHVRRLNLHRDVIEWPGSNRWARPSVPIHDVLFRGACLSGVRHVSVEYEWCGDRNLRRLADAILDETWPLQTLTVTAVDRRRRHQYQIRLARRPPNPMHVQDHGEVGEALLRRHPAVLMPWVKPDEAAAAAARRPGPGFAFFLVLRQSELDDAHFLESLRTEMRPPWEQPVLHNNTKSQRFGMNIRADVTLWLQLMKANPALLRSTSHYPQGSRTADQSIPCHGFCSSGYGLPDSQEPWNSYCLVDNINWEDSRYKLD